MNLPGRRQACTAMLRRELLLAWRRRADIAMPVLYALIVATLFPFALGPEEALLQRIAAGVVLVTVLLAMLLALDAMFSSDIEDGSLEQLADCARKVYDDLQQRNLAKQYKASDFTA